MMPEENAGGMAVEVEALRQHSVAFCCFVTAEGQYFCCTSSARKSFQNRDHPLINKVALERVQGFNAVTCALIPITKI